MVDVSRGDLLDGHVAAGASSIRAGRGAKFPKE
jgi:hypothetical protein